MLPFPEIELTAQPNMGPMSVRVRPCWYQGLFEDNLMRFLKGLPNILNERLARWDVTLGRFLAESWIGVGKSSYHQQSQTEIASDNPC